MNLPRLILPDTDKETVEAGVLGVGLWKRLVAQLKLLGGGSRKQVIEHNGYEVTVEAARQGEQDLGRVRVDEVEFVSFTGLPDPTKYRYLSTTREDLSTSQYVDVRYRVSTSDGAVTFFTVTPRVWPSEVVLYGLNFYGSALNFFEPPAHWFYAVTARGKEVSGAAIPTGIYELQDIPEDVISLGEADVITCYGFPEESYSGEGYGEWLISPLRRDTSRPFALEANSLGESPIQHEWEGEVVVSRDEVDGVIEGKARFNQTPVRQLGVGQTFVLNGDMRWFETGRKVALIALAVESSPLMASKPMQDFRETIIAKAREQFEVHGDWFYEGLLNLLDPTLEAKRLHDIKNKARRRAQSKVATEATLALLRNRELPPRWGKALERLSVAWLPKTGYFKYKPRIEYSKTGTQFPSPFTTRLKLEFDFDWPLEKDLPAIDECKVFEVLRDERSRVVRCSQLIEGVAEDTSPSDNPYSEMKYTNITTNWGVNHGHLNSHWWTGLAGEQRWDNNAPGTVAILSPLRVYSGYVDQGVTTTSWQEGVKEFIAAPIVAESGFVRYKTATGKYIPPYLSSVRLTSRQIEAYAAMFKYGQILTDEAGYAKATQGDTIDWGRVATEVLRARLKLRLVLFGPKEGGLFSNPLDSNQIEVYGVLEVKFDPTAREWVVHKWDELQPPVTLDGSAGLPTLYHNFLAMKDDAWHISSGTAVAGYGNPPAPSDNYSWINAVALVKGGVAPKDGIESGYSVDYSKNEGLVGEILRAAGVTLSPLDNPLNSLSDSEGL